MYDFGNKSREQFNTLHIDLQLILKEVIRIYDFSILEGIRTTVRQQELFKNGRSKLDGINKKSKHQGRKDKDGNIVSFAVDIMPYKKNTNAFEDTEDARKRFYFLAGIMFSVTQRLLKKGKISHNIRWGGDWQMDMVYNTKSEFVDLPHFELIKVK